MTNTANTPEKIKLFNKGKSTIHYGNAPKFDERNRIIPDEEAGSIKPDECVAFAPEMAKKLQRLYPKKLLSLEDVRDQFEKKNEKAESQDIKAIVAEAVAKAVAEALAAERAKALEEIEKSAAPLKQETEETEEELLARLQKEEDEAAAAKAEKEAKKEAKKK